VNTLTIDIAQKTDAANRCLVTLSLAGNLDNSTVGTLEPKLMSTLAAKPAHLIFDLARLKFVTSAGIRLFFIAVKQQKQHGGQASFVNLQPQIREVFAIMGELPDMPIFKDQAELDAYLLARQRTYNP
jgi:anti-anti-sigma factor